MLRHKARQRQVSTYSARLTWYASSSTGVRRKEGWWLFGGGICSTHSIYGCKVKWHFFLKALLSATKNRKESDPVRHCMNDGPGQSDEWASSTSFDTIQFCPPPHPTPNDIPKSNRSSSFSFKKPLAGHFLPLVSNSVYIGKSMECLFASSAG